ncbi:hypothetical protein F2P81_004833 [Scophthalmus maximus]|uniref:Uncharacterized protein n=1 Tax=Scophthalmus maximus TaxID=52904 RepID=A0A6A4T7H7_SCOMX|nr:hypothetical protein F2P81_004833 [Scophthalmus maximus]
MEVNRGARTLNEDIVASDHSTASAPPVHRGVMMEGFGIDFNLEEMKNCWTQRSGYGNIGAHHSSHVIITSAESSPLSCRGPRELQERRQGSSARTLG